MEKARGIKFEITRTFATTGDSSRSKPCVLALLYGQSEAAKQHLVNDFCEMGHTVFSLSYESNVAVNTEEILADLATAMERLRQEPESMGRSISDYIVCGTGVCAQAAALWGTSDYGYQCYHQPKPRMVVLFARGKASSNESAPIGPIPTDCLKRGYPISYVACDDYDINAPAWLRQLPAYLDSLNVPAILDNGDYSAYRALSDRIPSDADWKWWFQTFSSGWYPIPDQPIQGKRRIGCIGDSITYGAGVEWSRGTQSYPAILQELLGEAYQVINYGMSGRALLASSDMPFVQEENYSRSLMDRNDVYLCMLGTNDSKPYNWDAEKYEVELSAFLERYINIAGKRDVFVLKPPKAFVLDGQTEVNYAIKNNVIKDIGQTVQRVAAVLGISCIDLYALTESHTEWFDDGVHPNAAGNRAIAEMIYMELCREREVIP